MRTGTHRGESQSGMGKPSESYSAPPVDEVNVAETQRASAAAKSAWRVAGAVARTRRASKKGVCNTPREKASTPDFRAHLRRYTSSDARAWGAWMAAPWAWGTTSRARTRAARRARACTARCARRASPPSASTRRRRFQHLGPATEARAWSPPCPPARSASGPPSWRGASWGAAEASPRGARDPIRSVPASPLAPFAHASPANKSENNRWEVAVLSCFRFLARDETGFR